MPPEITAEKNSNHPIIYYLCPCYLHPVGGVKQLYRHVNILNKNGFTAFIIHPIKGYRCSWFENNTPVVYDSRILDSITNKKRSGQCISIRRCLSIAKRTFSPRYLAENMRRWQIPNVQISHSDYLVLPESWGSVLSYAQNLGSIGKGIKKIIFNQNAHYTFCGYSVLTREMKTPYFAEDIIATMVVSEHSLEYLRALFPYHHFGRIYCGIDSNIFFYSPHKKKQIAYMPRKLSDVSTQIINALKVRGSINDFEIVAIDGKSEKDVARILQDSLLFLSFSYREGCPLPPMEAMVCGCVVIGYDGYGGKEYFKKDFCYPVNYSDDMEFIRVIEYVIAQYRKDQNTILSKGRRASEYILKEYSLDREEASVLNFWKRIMAPTYV